MYYIIILKIIKKIAKNSRERIGKTTIKEIMQKKINNLKLLLKFYENDINKTINNLNRIYDDYKENYNLKMKEEWKLFKRYEAKEIKSNQNENLFNSIKLIRRYKLFELSGKKYIYLYSMLFTIIISLILYISILIIWYIYFKKDNIMNEWSFLTNGPSLEISKLMTNLLAMIYNNQTLDEISLSFKTEDYISYIYTKLTNIYQADKYKSIILSITHLGAKDLNYDCTHFYSAEFKYGNFTFGYVCCYLYMCRRFFSINILERSLLYTFAGIQGIERVSIIKNYNMASSGG
jgi:hypothetical protein